MQAFFHFFFDFFYLCKNYHKKNDTYEKDYFGSHLPFDDGWLQIA